MLVINTDAVSKRYRQAAIDLDAGRLLMTNFTGTEQELDLTEPANCGGFGRIRHFRRASGGTWPNNPLPIDPAYKALGHEPVDTLRAQVFQNAVCNWRCWYCFVPFNLLAANKAYADWLSPEDLITLYLDQADPPLVIDLSGGQPDLTPEWVPWMMTAIEKHGLADRVFLWSDDNLSNDYFWRYLTLAERERVAAYPLYSRVCCFKGYNAGSFQFNTLADAALFDQQFELMARLHRLGIDLYAYTTFTTPDVSDIKKDMRLFVDRLQAIHPNLPLRTVPLEIRVFTPVASRVRQAHTEALAHQHVAIEAWAYELEQRFSREERAKNIADVPID